MPGRKLSSEEEKLLRFWKNPPQSWDKPILVGLEVGGGTGLRGIRGLAVRFRFPITAICGGNGVGKSTILALSALAHHSTEGWRAHWLADVGLSGKSYYIFSDFFVSGVGDQPVEGLSVTWRYFIGGREVQKTFTKNVDRWGRYADRPQREVAFLPLSRVLPAYEVAAIRTNFSRTSSASVRDMLGSEFRSLLSFIMGRSYEEAEIHGSRRHTFHRCRTTTSYTGFNMGSGETCAIALLHLLQRIPRGGLIVVEEIETGLHPQAQKRLIEVLVSLCWQKKVQIICSTHSEIILDALPREARLLLRRMGDEHTALEAPSTRFAVYEMTGEVQPELTIYCEDKVAAIMIEESLPANVRLRVVVRDVGDKVSVIRQGVAHGRGGFLMGALCVLDGDCRESEVEEWIRSETGSGINAAPRYLMLPGDGMPPERWILEQMRYPPYRADFAREFGCSAQEAQAHVDAAGVELEHHNLAWTLNKRTGIEASDCLRRIMRAVAPRHPQLEPLREKIATLLA